MSLFEDLRKQASDLGLGLTPESQEAVASGMANLFEPTAYAGRKIGDVASTAVDYMVPDVIATPVKQAASEGLDYVHKNTIVGQMFDREIKPILDETNAYIQQRPELSRFVGNIADTGNVLGAPMAISKTAMRNIAANTPNDLPYFYSGDIVAKGVDMARAGVTGVKNAILQEASPYWRAVRDQTGMSKTGVELMQKLRAKRNEMEPQITLLREREKLLNEWVRENPKDEIYQAAAKANKAELKKLTDELSKDQKKLFGQVGHESIVREMYDQDRITPYAPLADTTYFDRGDFTPENFALFTGMPPEEAAPFLRTILANQKKYQGQAPDQIKLIGRQGEGERSIGKFRADLHKERKYNSVRQAYAETNLDDFAGDIDGLKDHIERRANEIMKEKRDAQEGMRYSPKRDKIKLLRNSQDSEDPSLYFTWGSDKGTSGYDVGGVQYILRVQPDARAVMMVVDDYDIVGMKPKGGKHTSIVTPPINIGYLGKKAPKGSASTRATATEKNRAREAVNEKLAQKLPGFQDTGDPKSLIQKRGYQTERAMSQALAGVNPDYKGAASGAAKLYGKTTATGGLLGLRQSPESDPQPTSDSMFGTYLAP